MTPPSSPAPRAPSRELDALIAEKVMGWKLFEVGYCGTEDETPEQRRYAKALAKQGDNAVGTYAYVGGGKVIAYDNGFCDPFRPSTDIADAWHVVEKMRADGYEVIIGLPPHRGACFCEVAKPSDRGSDVEYADTAPLAICLAALAAVAPPRAPLEGE